LDVAKFLSTSDPALADTAKNELLVVTNDAQELRSLLHDAKLQAATDDVAAEIKEFASALDAEQTDLRALSDIVSAKLDKITLDMRKRLEDAIAENQAIEEELGPETTDEMRSTRWTAVTLSIVAVIAGLLIAFFTARSISRPVVGMTRAME